LKTDAPILIDAPQKFEDPGLCWDPFQIEVRRTPEAQLPQRRMILPTPISSNPSYLAAETGLALRKRNLVMSITSREGPHG